MSDVAEQRLKVKRPNNKLAEGLENIDEGCQRWRDQTSAKMASST